MINQKHQIKKMPYLKHFENEYHKRIYIALKQTVDNGMRPLKIPILRLAGLDRGYFEYGKQSWKQDMLKLIETKELEWQQHGGIEYIKIDKIIDEKIKKRECPSESVVLQAAGFSDMYFRDKDNFYPFREKLFKRIKSECLAFENAKILERELIQEQLAKQMLESIPDEMELLRIEGFTAEELFETFFQNNASEEICKSVGLLLPEIRESAIPFSHVMYAERERVPTNSRSYYINPGSFNISRIPILYALIQLAYKNRNNPNTLLSTLKEVLEYLDYCDNLDEHFIPANKEGAREGYQSFILHLRKKISLNTLSSGSGNIIQNKVIVFLKFIFPNHDDRHYIFKKIKKIKRDYNSNSNEVEDNSAMYAITYYAQFFLKVCKLLFDEKTIFPCAISIQEKHYLCIPYNDILIHHESPILVDRSPFQYYNVNTGSFRTINEIAPLDEHFSEYHRSNKMRGLKNIESIAKDINSNFNHRYRLQLAERAFQAFYMLLSAITGMKDSELANLRWGDDDQLDIEKTASKGIVTIKPRAHYKEMNYEIHRYGVTLLRQAVKLRRYLLQGYQSENFFFIGCGANISITSALKSGKYGGEIIRKHQVINPDLPRIGTRKLRIFKSSQIMKQSNGNAWLASVMLGHSLSVNISHYQSKAKKERESELRQFAELMLQNIKNRKNDNSKPICESYDTPEFFFENKALTCDNIFACFICKKHRLHPDEEDIHKLLSLRYVIQRINTARAFSKEHFDTVLQPVDEMTLALLKLMATKYGCGALINTIQDRVYKKAELHSYWDFKIRYLYELGVI